MNLATLIDRLTAIYKNQGNVTVYLSENGLLPDIEKPLTNVWYYEDNRIVILDTK